MYKRAVQFLTVLAALCIAALAQDITGDWQGKLKTPGGDLRIVFHISAHGAEYGGAFDSPDQGAKDLPLSAVKRTGSHVVFEFDPAHAKFEGAIDSNSTRIDGEWSQGGASLPLVLTRTAGTAESKPKRPQEPAPPFPYRSEDVGYENKQAGIRLAGTLTLPQGKGPFRAALLITGSGPQDRDETLMGHKPFLVLSDYLTRHGIAVLRTDDRGIAKSGGNFATATTADFATDAEAGLAYLKTRPEIDVKKIGLIGHSEGGAIASMVAARNPDVAFIVLLAGSGLRGDETVVSQVGAGLAASGASQKQIEEAEATERKVLTLVEKEKDPAELRTDLAKVIPERTVERDFPALTSPWYRYFLEYDPSTALRKVKCPVLALDGTKDVQVVAKENLPAIRKALTEGGNKRFEIDEMPGLNHLFQDAKTGAVSEYESIEETMSPAVLEKVASWIAKQ